LNKIFFILYFLNKKRVGFMKRLLVTACGFLLLMILINSCVTQIEYGDSLVLERYRLPNVKEENLLVNDNYKLNLPYGWKFYRALSISDNGKISVYNKFKDTSGGIGGVQPGSIDNNSLINLRALAEISAKYDLKNCFEIIAHECKIDKAPAYILNGLNKNDYREYTAAMAEGNEFVFFNLNSSPTSKMSDSSIAYSVIASYELMPSELSVRKLKGIPTFINTEGTWWWGEDLGDFVTGYKTCGKVNDVLHCIRLKLAKSNDIYNEIDRNNCNIPPYDTEITLCNKQYKARAIGFDSTGGDSFMYYLFTYNGYNVLMTLSTDQKKSGLTTRDFHKSQNFIDILNNNYFAEDLDFHDIMHRVKNKQNLGRNVNSRFSELVPIISPDGKTLYYCRDHHPENLDLYYGSNQDIWYSELQSDGSWSEAKNMGSPLNDRYPNAPSSVTPDGNTLLLLGVYNRDGTHEKGLSMSHRTKDGWSFPEKLYIKNYYNNITSTSECLSSDGKAVIMSLVRKDTKGINSDLYASFLLNNNEWTEPMNLGPAINTDSSEWGPFLAPDGITLYYSSDMPGGFGSNDVYITRRLDSTWKNWSKPENLGPLVNTSGSESYYTVSAKGDYVYFCNTNHSYGRGDILRMALDKKEFKPTPVILISGKVLNAKTNEPIEAKVFYETLPDGKEAGIARTNPMTGEYKIVLPAGSKYGFRAEADGYFAINDNIDAIKIEEYKEIERNLSMLPIKKGEAVRLNNIFFDYDKSDLRPESFPELDRLVKFLNDSEKLIIEVAGHTDNIGTDAYNNKLSKDRAAAVANYLITKNISKNRISSKGYGKTKPVSTNNTEEGRQLNRRVEFVIVSD
jgi:outer membrane protein OmpA-like peptidoglycan-associated protein